MKVFQKVSQWLLLGCLITSIVGCGGGGGSSSSSGGGTTTPTNIAPTVNAGSDQSVNEQSNIVLNGSASDSDGTIQSWLWTQTDGQTVAITAEDSATPGFVTPTVLLSEGAVQLGFSVTVTDNDGATATDSVTIVVNPVNATPTINAGSDLASDEGATVTLSGQASDSDGSIAEVEWRQIQGTTVQITDISALTASFVAPIDASNQTYIFELKATDNEGHSVTDTVSVDVTPIIAGIAVDDVLIGSTVQLLNIEDLSVIVETQTDEDGRYKLSGQQSLPSRYVLSITGGTLNGQPFVGTLSSVCMLTERAACNTTPLTTLIKRFAEKRNELQNGDKSTWVETLSSELGFDLSTEPFVNEDQSQISLDNIRDFLQNGEQVEQWIDATLNYVENDEPDSQVEQWFPTANIPPTASMGEDFAINENTEVTLTVNANDPDGTIASYAWSQSGPVGVILTDQSVSSVTFTTPSVIVPTVLTIIVEVTDNDLARIFTDVSITINPVNEAPTVTAGNDQSVNEQTTVILNATATDIDGSIASYSWTQTSGTNVTLSNAQSAQSSFTAPTITQSENLIFMVSVTDNEGATANDSVSVTVLPVNATPSVSAGEDQSVDEQIVVTLKAAATDSDGTISVYNWRQTSGSSVTLTDSSSAQATFTAPTIIESETLAFTVTVTDNEGATAEDSIVVTVNPVNAAPTVDAGNSQSVTEQVEVTLNASASDSDGSISNYLWQQTAGTSVTLNNASSASTTFTSPSVNAQQTLTFSVTVTDNEGGSSSDTVNVIVNSGNAIPVVNAGDDQSVDEQTTVILSGSGTDSDGTITSYLWSQTSGTSVTLNSANTASTTFTAPTLTQSTTLTFSLSVTDNEGGVASDSVNVTVNPVNVAPVANAGADQIVSVGDTVTLSGSQSSDDDGDSLTYSWTLSAMPDGSSASLSNAAMVSASFTADVKGSYVANLVVNDGTENSPADSVSITANAVNSAPTGSISLSGSFEVGGTVSASNDLADANGLGSFSYQWRRTKDGSAADISDATSSSYSVVNDDVGYTLSMNISYTDGDGFAESVNSSESATVTQATDAGKPNILLIISDDQGLDASAQYSLSSDLPSTPNIDAMATSGIVFDNLWATPACTTTRGTLITGQHGVNSGITTVPYEMNTSTNTLQRYIKSLSGSSDYQTAVIGKWHLGGGNPDLTHPTDSGVDYYAGTIAGTIDDYYSWDLVENGQSSTVTDYHTTKITDLAIDWLSTQNTANTPWFMWLAYVAPHSPFHLPPADLHNRTDLTGESDHIDDNKRDYYLAAIEAMDSEIGRLLDSLSAKEKENTLIVFIGDNGTPAAVIDTSVYQRAHSKGSLYEGGIRVPMVVSGNGVSRQNVREDALVNTTDFYATLSQFVGGTDTQINDSYSFMSLLSNEGDGLRSYNYSEFVSDDVTGFVVRDTTYKVFDNTTDSSQELYKVSTDAVEATNLSSESSLTFAMTSLSNQGKTIRGESTTTPLDITNANFINRSGNCADYVESYTSSVKDVNRDLAFAGDVKITVSNGKCIFDTNNIPNHDFNDNDAFVNEVSEQDQQMQVTASPANAASTTSLTLTTDNAILLNGVKVDLLAAACYGVGDGKVGCNDIDQPWRYDPMFAANGFRVDTHNAHSQPNGAYHYHGQPNAMFDDEDGTVESAVIGFAADGYPIYGPYFSDNGTIRKATSSFQLKSGDRPSGSDDPGGSYDGTYRDDYEYIEASGDLDECNGMTMDGVYGYYITDGYPYVLGCFKGTPDSSFDK